MEWKAMNKQFKLAAYFLLLTVLLQGVSVDACVEEDKECDPNNPDCCEGLVCLEVSDGVFKCEPEECEDHVGHPCEPGVRECCDPLKCSDTCNTCFDPNCKKTGESCDGTTTVCCEGYECSLGNCVCKKNLGDPCDPDACINECCDLKCAAAVDGTYKCLV